MFYKTINGLTPEYLRELVPPLVQGASTYALRNADHIRTIHASSNLYYSSFFPSTIRASNSLSDEIESAPNVAAFKYCLNENLRKPCHHAICNNAAICNKQVYYKLRRYYKLRGDKAAEILQLRYAYGTSITCTP